MELAISWIDIVTLIISILTLIGLGIYAYFTYLIAKDTQEPFISFILTQIEDSHTHFSMTNKSKVEVEVLSKLWTKVNNQIFQFRNGFYADDTNWIIQPFTTGGGHFFIKDLTNDDGVNLEDYLSQINLNSIDFNLQIKYRKVGSRNWKKSSPQNYIYNFETKQFWLNV